MWYHLLFQLFNLLPCCEQQQQHQHTESISMDMVKSSKTNRKWKRENKHYLLRLLHQFKLNRLHLIGNKPWSTRIKPNTKWRRYWRKKFNFNVDRIFLSFFFLTLYACKFTVPLKLKEDDEREKKCSILDFDAIAKDDIIANRIAYMQKAICQPFFLSDLFIVFKPLSFNLYE